MADASPDVKAVVYRAIKDLEDQYGRALRTELPAATGLAQNRVDDAVKCMVDEDRSVQRLRGGVFKTVKFFEEPFISFTPLDDGRFKLEVGDDVITLTPRALRLIFAMTAGFAMMHGKMPIEPHDRGLSPNLELFR